MQTLGLKIQGRRASNSASFEALEALFSSASFEALEALFSIFKIERVYHFFWVQLLEGSLLGQVPKTGFQQTRSNTGLRGTRFY